LFVKIHKLLKIRQSANLEVNPMSGSIRIVHDSKQICIQPSCWAPAFQLRLREGGLIRETEKFYPADESLVFHSKEQADRWSDEAARKWCKEHYPDWTIE
jgi:hypothetical protein